MRMPVSKVLSLLAAVSLLVALTAGAVDAAPGERVLVRFRPGTSEAAVGAVLAAVSAAQVGTVYGSDVRVLTAPRGARALVASLTGRGEVDYAEPEVSYRLFLERPNDPRFGEQYAHARLRSVEGWASYPGSYTGSGAPPIAVIDTGVSSSHEDLAGRVDSANSSCFVGLLCLLSGFRDDNGHGTHTAGIAVAAANNGRGVAGVAFNARVMALKACRALGDCPLSAVAGAINWARERRATVISMSLGGPEGSATLAAAVKAAHDAGIVVVAAAGNDGDGTLNYPAAYPEVVSVGATDAADRRAGFSNQNADVELAAPGVDVLSTWPGGLLSGSGYRKLSGTSMAAPHVAGLAALLAGQHPDWTGPEVRARMAACADDLGDAGRDPAFGHGRINLARALGTC